MEDGLSRSSSKGLSRLRSALRKGSAVLSRSSRAVVQRISEPQDGAPLLRSASSASRSRKVLHGLLRLRREGDDSEEEQEHEDEEWREGDAGERDAGAPARRRVSVKSPAAHESPRSSPRSSWKRVSLRGLTTEEGLLTRAEAKRFSLNRRERSMSKEEALQVLGRNSISAGSLMRLAKKGEHDKVVALVESGLVDVNARDEEGGKTALHVAAGHGHAATVVALYGLDADLELLDGKGNTPLISAAAKGRCEVVLTLLSCGANPRARNRRGETALVCAANRAAHAADAREFKEAMEIVRAMFARAAPYEHDDSQLIEDDAMRVLLDQWLDAKQHRRDLHIPSFATFRGNTDELHAFFEKAHKTIRPAAWAKIALLVIFVLYDTYSPHFANNGVAYLTYIGLYVAAYQL